MTYDEIKNYASSLGYDFSDEDCQELLKDSFDGESVEDAVDDFIRAYEK